MRRKTEVTSNQVRSIVARYNKGGKGNGLIGIAEAVKLSPGIVRRVLLEQNVTLRGRGRPRIVKAGKKSKKVQA